jgi:hypothetical protein
LKVGPNIGFMNIGFFGGQNGWEIFNARIHAISQGGVGWWSAGRWSAGDAGKPHSALDFD